MAIRSTNQVQTPRLKTRRGLQSERTDLWPPPPQRTQTQVRRDFFGVQHGFKSPQIALSSLAAEALGRCMPLSAFSRSTEAHNQDKVSMGAAAARAARDVIELAERCCAIHLLGACQAADLRGGPELLGDATRAAYEKVRAVSPFVERDRALQEDIQAVARLIRAGDLA